MSVGCAVRLASAAELNLEKTFTCGQCFRWEADERGVYSGVAFGRAASFWEADGQVWTDAPEAEARLLWHPYFDLDLDYTALAAGFDAGDYLRDCARAGAGIRILRQDKWETLCSFILSQCNNIPRIRGIVARLCRAFGQPLTYGERTLYTFPGPEKLAPLTPEKLSPLRCGYRAPYVIGAARAVAEGRLDLEALAGQSREAALAALRTLEGVGEKVANCVVLFGLHMLSGFPVDVWMKRTLKAHFPPDFDPASLGAYAGVAQQYMFYCEAIRARGPEKLSL